MKRSLDYQFRLYIAGDAPNSVRAQVNLESLCKTHFPDQYQVEIVDVVKDPARALQDGILLTPTTVKLAPGPVRKIVGNLSQLAVVKETFGLNPV